MRWGGRMVIESAPGRGTKVTLTVPYTAELIKQDEAAGPVQEGVVSQSAGSMPVRQPGESAASSEPDGLPTGKTRVLLVDDHAMLRQGLRTVLEGYADIEVVGEATNGEQAVMLAKSLHPDIVIMDINMPGMDGIEATRRLKMEQPETLVIGLSVHNNWQVEQVMREAGAVS